LSTFDHFTIHQLTPPGTEKNRPLPLPIHGAAVVLVCSYHTAGNLVTA